MFFLSKQFYEEQRLRVQEALAKADPLSREYVRGLAIMHDLDYRLSQIGQTADPETETQKTDEPEPEAPQKIAAPEVTTDEAQPAYDFAYVRGRLADARSEKGVNITALFDKLGYENLSAVPVGEYGRLLDALDAELKEKK